MCSHPIVHATQLARVRRVRLPDLLGRDADGFIERARLKVAGRQDAQAIERQQVGGGAQLAVFRGGGTERPFRQRLAVFGELARMRPLAPLRAADGNRLQVLAAEHRAAAAAAGMASVVRDRRVADPAFPGGANRRDLIVRAEAGLERRFRGTTRCPTKIFRRLEPDLPVINDQGRQRCGPSDDDDGVAAATLAGNRESAAGERIVDPIGQRTLADDGKFCGRGQRAADQWAEDEDERRLWRERIRARAALLEQQPRPSPLPPRYWRRTVSAMRHALDAAATRRRCADSSRDTRRARRARQPPASAERISTQSLALSRVWGSLMN